MQLKEQHAIRMESKRLARMKAYARNHNPNEYVPANLGRNHPDYRMNMEDHEKEKVARNTQKSS